MHKINSTDKLFPPFTKNLLNYLTIFSITLKFNTKVKQKTFFS